MYENLQTSELDERAGEVVARKVTEGGSGASDESAQRAQADANARNRDGLTVVGQVEEVASSKQLWLHVVLEPERFGDLHLELYKTTQRYETVSAHPSCSSTLACEADVVVDCHLPSRWEGELIRPSPLMRGENGRAQPSLEDGTVGPYALWMKRE
jgi:hypothetical protein